MKSTTFAAALFAVTMVANAETIVDTFESGTVSWEGSTLSTTPETPTEPDKYGYPVADADHTNHSKTLSISGTATRTTSGNNVFDMMVKLNKTDDDELPEPDDSALFAVAVDNSGNLKLYCKSTSGGTASWSSLGKYDLGAWARLTFDVDKDEGSFVVATNGVLTDATYYLAATPSANIVTNVAVIGTTAIDDFVAKTGTFEPYAQVNGDGTAAVTGDLPVKYIAQAETDGGYISKSSPKMTVAQAYAAGVPPTEGATFDIEEATFDGSNLKLTFPGDWPAGTYTIKYGTTTACKNEATFTSAVKSNGRNQVTVEIQQEDFGDGNVLYYTVSR